ncbi:MAG: sugar transferase [Bacteroidales bacterium]
MAAWFTYNIFRYHLMPLEEVYGSFIGFISSPRVIAGQIVFPSIFMFIFFLSGYYNRPLLKSRLDELFTTLFSVLIGVLGILFLSLLNKYIYTKYNYKLVSGLFTIIFIFVYIGRGLITSHITKLIHNRILGFRTLIIGCSENAVRLASSINNCKHSLGYDIIGYVGKDDEKCKCTNLPLFNLNTIEETIKNLKIEELIISPSSNDARKTYELINSLYKFDLPIFLEANEYEMLTSRIKLSNIYGTPLIDVSVCAMSDAQKNIKRLCDIVFSSLALIILTPLFVYLYIHISLTSKGNVIYKQKRVGYKRKEFTMYKFRTMIENAEREIPMLSDYNDPRITGLGHWMRKYRIDELPQFWNVIKGDMSIVGPRPERKYFIDKIVERAPYYSLLHQVRPGITSLGMINFGYARNIDEMIARLKYDIIYLENMSLLIDMKIISYTVKIVLTGRGI